MRAQIRIAIVGLSLVSLSFPGCVAGSRRVDPFDSPAPLAASRVVRPSVADRVRARLARIWDRDETPREVVVPELVPTPTTRVVRDGVLDLPRAVEEVD
ncbi:hypothetical protein [Paludisphaera sp.]|uniref:hypothetical protein n=1 Tax=Paludisphaera sp. TaxID=2017432 RepID=UPI00301D0501